MGQISHQTLPKLAFQPQLSDTEERTTASFLKSEKSFRGERRFGGLLSKSLLKAGLTSTLDQLAQSKFGHLPRQ